jgi:hypothetical protein
LVSEDARVRESAEKTTIEQKDGESNAVHRTRASWCGAQHAVQGCKADNIEVTRKAELGQVHDGMEIEQFQTC